MVNKGSRKKILLLAYACSPFKGSEPGVGWGRSIETVKYYDTWVICKKQQYEDDIKQYFAKYGKIPGLHFYFISRTKFEKFLKSIPGFFYIAYYLWHRRAYRLAVKLHEQVNFDLVHHVNWNCFREPGYLWKLNVPFIWGPVGGMEKYPWRFLREAGIKVAFSEILRTIINVIQFRYSRRVRKAANRAEALFVINNDGCYQFEQVHGCSPIVMQDIGIHQISENPKKFDNSRPIRILIGSQMKSKYAHQLLLRALYYVPSSFKYQLKIAGKGPQEVRWRKLAKSLNIRLSCKWLGWLSLKSLNNEYEWTDIFVFTGLRNATNTMVLHALSMGVPVICLDHQGVGDLVTEECGIKIPVTTPKEVILNLRDAIVFASQNRQRLEQFSKNCLKRAHDFLWSRKIKMTSEVYNNILSKGGTK